MDKEPQTMKSLGSMLPKPEQGHCDQHGDFSAIRIGERALACPTCQKEKIELEDAKRTQIAEESARNRQQAALKSLVYHSGIPPRFRSKTFDDFKPDDDKQHRIQRICRAYADRFDERLSVGGGIVMCGHPGTGKTHLACAIGNQLMEAGRSVLFISLLAAARSVKETYRKDSEERERHVLSKFFEPQLLILDEVGMQIGSDTEKMIVYEIVNGRYERVMPTILLSNLPEAELGAFVGDRVTDRMQEGGGVLLTFDWQSKRKDIKTASTAMPDWVSK